MTRRPRPFHVPKPCDDCPFRRSPGAVRLDSRRIREIAGGALGNPGRTFACHKTTGVLGRVRRGLRNQHCAGALIFSEKHDHATQMMRIAERLGMYDAAALLALPDAADIFESTAEWLTTAHDRGRPRR